MDPDVTVWCMFTIIWFAEAIGGFTAVAMTGSIQSVIMMVGIVAMSCYAQSWYGGMGGSTSYDCGSLATNVLKYDNTTLATNGCLARSAPWQTLYPTIAGDSEFFSSTAVVAIDAASVFNRTAVYILSFNMLFFAFALNPHWISRLIASRSDGSFKNTCAIMSFNGIFTTIPMLVVGIVAAASLKGTEAAGTSAFALFIDEMLERGGTAGFFGTIAACSALAAIMSVSDSTTFSFPFAPASHDACDVALVRSTTVAEQVAS